MDKKLRQQVFDRDGGYCAWCGKPLDPNDFAIHHRKLKSRGGKDEAPNLICLHHRCHNIGTKSVHLNPNIATKKGFMVSAYDDPRVIPIQMPNGTTIDLNDGTEPGN